MRSWLQTPLLCVLLALSLAASFQYLGLLNVKPLYHLDPGKEDAAIPSRTPMLLVVVDGLREDTARSMPALQRIAQQGASARVLAELPTFSAAAYTTLLTGMSPLNSGRRTNYNLFAAGVDSLPDQVADHGRVARVLSDEVDWWKQLFPRGFKDSDVVPTDKILDRAGEWMTSSDLLVVHLCEVDEAGHSSGGSSEAYRQAARDADRIIAALAERWAGRGVMSVISDHGHVSGGGHGGDEDDVRNTWWVSEGPGVAKHSGKTLAATQVAPTLAAWMGVPSPALAEGNAAAVLVDAPAQDLARLSSVESARVQKLEGVRGRALARIRVELGRSRQARGLVLGLMAAALLWARRRSLRGIAVGASWGAAAFALAAGLFVLLWGPPSFSAAPAPGYLAMKSGLLFLGCAVLISPGVMPWFKAPARRGELLLGLALAATAPAAIFFVLEGALSDRVLPGNSVLASLPLQLWPVAAGGALLALAAGFIKFRRSGP